MSVRETRCKCVVRLGNDAGWRDTVGYRRLGDDAVDYRLWAVEKCPDCNGTGAGDAPLPTRARPTIPVVPFVQVPPPEMLDRG